MSFAESGNRNDVSSVCRSWIVGLLSFAPLGLIFAWMANLWFDIGFGDEIVPFDTMALIVAAGLLVSLGIAIAYIRHVRRNRRLPTNMQTAWTLVLLLGYPVTMPIYWWLYVRREA